MVAVTPIRDDTERATVLSELRRLWGAETGTTAGDRVDALMVLMDDYEARHHAIGFPDPIATI